MNNEKQPPSEESLKNLLKMGGADIVYTVETLIKQYKLPFEVKQDNETGEGTLVSILSQGEQHLARFITVTPALITLKENALKAAKSPYEVLITGETGTGKEIIASSMIWNRKGPIKALNCAGFPSELFESELFGHKKGSFTGAYSDKLGLALEANDGVLFLDEVGDLPLHMQAKLLRVIQSKMVRGVGFNEETPINCKFVFATNRNLATMVEAGLFRRDLYARISTLHFHISPLRDRKEDIIPIITSLPDGSKFLEVNSDVSKLDLSLNVRSLQQHIIRWKVLGEIL